MIKNISLLVLMALLLTGCASSPPPSPWQGIPYQERDMWSSMAVSAYDAKTLRSNGFTPLHASEWIRLGIRSPDEIISWYRAGFSAQQASKWLAKGLSIRDAIDLAR